MTLPVLGARFLSIIITVEGMPPRSRIVRGAYGVREHAERRLCTSTASPNTSDSGICGYLMGGELQFQPIIPRTGRSGKGNRKPKSFMSKTKSAPATVRRGA